MKVRVQKVPANRRSVKKTKYESIYSRISKATKTKGVCVKCVSFSEKRLVECATRSHLNRTGLVRKYKLVYDDTNNLCFWILKRDRDLT